MTPSKPKNNRKLIRNIAIGAVSSLALWGLYRLSKNQNEMTDDNTSNPQDTQGFSTFFYPPVENIGLRSDPLGDGAYGASRGGGTRSHNGIDLLAVEGQNIFSPMDGTMVRIANPYTNDPNYNGLLLRGSGLWQGYEIKMFYMAPFIVPGELVYPGKLIGVAQSIRQKWGNAMLDHIHLEVKKDGNFIDPTPLFFGTV